MNNSQYFKYGTFINDVYKEHDTLDDAAELFDSSVALGIVLTGRIVGWMDLYDYETLYDHTEALEYVHCNESDDSPAT